MRILICNRPGGAFGYISDGWLNALRDKGHIVRRWDGYVETWQEFSPQLYIGCSGHRQPIPARRGDCKIAIHVNPLGPVSIGGINETDDNIKWVLLQRPDVVFGYGFESDRLIWSGWTTNYNIPWVPLPTAGDRIIFKELAGSIRPHDIVYLGGRWPYKSQTIDTFLLPVIRSKEFYSSIRGWGDWPPGICDGGLPEDEACSFLNGGKIGPCISEPHTHNYGIDIPERMFKLALCGTLAICDSASMIKQHVLSMIVSKNSTDFHDLCRYYIRNDVDRIAAVKQQQIEVLNNHTYHHRMQSLLDALGFDVEARRMVNDGDSV
jgi:hypothetical protein